MSEFSESFHLRTDDDAEAERLLGLAGVAGAIILPQQGRFITIIVRADDTSVIIKQNRLILIFYSFAEDYECSISVYDADRHVAELVYENTAAQILLAEVGDLAPPAKRQDRDVALRTMENLGLVDSFGVQQLLHLEMYESSAQWGGKVADVLGLNPVSHLSGDYLTAPQLLRERFPHILFIP